MIAVFRAGCGAGAEPCRHGRRGRRGAAGGRRWAAWWPCRRARIGICRCC